MGKLPIANLPKIVFPVMFIEKPFFGKFEKNYKTQGSYKAQGLHEKPHISRSGRNFRSWEKPKKWQHSQCHARKQNEYSSCVIGITEVVTCDWLQACLAKNWHVPFFNMRPGPSSETQVVQDRVSR